MRQTTLILTFVGALLLGFVLLHHSQPARLPPSPVAELASTDAEKERPSHTGRLAPEIAAPQPVEIQPTTNLLLRLYRGEAIPLLRPEQVAAYLEANHRGVESLLGAYRTTRDKGSGGEVRRVLNKYPPAEPAVQ